MKFLKENWLWIVLPILLAAAVVFYVISTAGESGVDEFIYPI